MSRARSRAPSWIERVTLRAGMLGVQRCRRSQPVQSCWRAPRAGNTHPYPERAQIRCDPARNPGSDRNRIGHGGAHDDVGCSRAPPRARTARAGAAAQDAARAAALRCRFETTHGHRACSGCTPAPSAYGFSPKNWLSLVARLLPRARDRPHAAAAEVALLTGVISGIGLETAAQFAEAGALAVIVNGRDSERGQAAVWQILQSYRRR